MKIRYRPEIDGLRAVAVIAVIIYHLKVTGFLSGGYLGVDVFFVISGFLISSMIIKELTTTKTFSFSNFYKRRVRRLMPVFFTVFITSSIASYFLLLPSQLLSFAKSGLASLCFVANHFWYSTSLEYDAQSSLLEPFLHTWTLSIEEQFYMIFPPLIYCLFVYCRKYLVVVISLFTVASLLFAELYFTKNQSFCFYLLPARLWELSAGTLLAILNYKNLDRDRDRGYFNNMSSVFFVILFCCFVFFNNETKHPSLITLIPILSTLGILYFANAKDLVIKMLSSKVFVFIGLLSYSIYLWHFPVFAFGRNLYFENSLFDYSIWIGLTFIFSFISYKFIEQPFRNKAIVKPKKFLCIMIVMVLISCLASFLIINNEGYPSRYDNLGDIYFGNEIDNKRLKDKREVFFNKVISEPIFKDEGQKVLILGDSHSKDLFLSFYLNKDLYNGYSFYRMPFLGSNKDKLIRYLESEEFKKADVIIFCSKFSNKMEMFVNIEVFIQEIKKRNKRIIVALNTAEFNSYGRDEIFDKLAKEYSSKIEQLDHDLIYKYFYENRKKHIDSVNDSILNFVNRMDIEYLDRYALVCDNKSEICKGISPDGKKTYSDGSHLTLEGAKYFGKQLRKVDCLFETNYVNNKYLPNEISSDFNIDKLKKEKDLDFKEMNDLKSEYKKQLKNTNLTKEERKKLIKEQRKKLRKIRKKIMRNKNR